MATILPKREGENGAQRISNKNSIRGCWVAQSFKGLILGSGLGRDPRVLGWSPNSGFALSVEPEAESRAQPGARSQDPELKLRVGRLTD